MNDSFKQTSFDKFQSENCCSSCYVAGSTWVCLSKNYVKVNESISNIINNNNNNNNNQYKQSGVTLFSTGQNLLRKGKY